MSSTIRRFEFDLLGGKSFGLSPAIVITVERATSHHGAPCISSNLTTAAEVDDYVAALKADLDSVARRAKVALRESTWFPTLASRYRRSPQR